MTDRDTEVIYEVRIFPDADPPRVTLALEAGLFDLPDVLADMATRQWQQQIRDGVAAQIAAVVDGVTHTERTFVVEELSGPCGHHDPGPLDPKQTYGPVDVLTRVLDAELGEDSSDTGDYLCTHCTRELATGLLAALADEGYTVAPDDPAEDV